MNQSERNMQLLLEEVYRRLNDAYDVYAQGLKDDHRRQLTLWLEGISDVLDDLENDPDNPDLPSEEATHAQV